MSATPPSVERAGVVVVSDERLAADRDRDCAADDFGGEFVIGLERPFEGRLGENGDGIVISPHQTKQAGPDEQRRIIAAQTLDADADARILREMDGERGFDPIVRPCRPP